jgi:hypothetical protein
LRTTIMADSVPSPSAVDALRLIPTTSVAEVRGAHTQQTYRTSVTAVGQQVTMVGTRVTAMATAGTSSIHHVRKEDVLPLIRLVCEVKQIRENTSQIYTVNYAAEAIGYACLLQYGSRVDWIRFYPFGNLPSVEDAKNAPWHRKGIGALVHAQIVDNLYVHSAPDIIAHADLEPERDKHLGAMGITDAENATFPFPEYRRKSLAYAAMRGFTPDIWNPILVLPSK